jgi:Family of unknown function (DUF6644)
VIDVHALLQWLHDSWLGEYARHTFWVFTTGLVIHFIGLCLLLGAMLVVDLRLLDLLKGVAIRAVTALLPLAIVGFCLNLLTGFVFFCFDPFGYWQNPAFRTKMVLVLIAGLNALFVHVTAREVLASKDPDQRTGALLKLNAAGSLLIWFSVILFGRMIVAFQGASSFFG